MPIELDASAHLHNILKERLQNNNKQDEIELYYELLSSGHSVGEILNAVGLVRSNSEHVNTATAEHPQSESGGVTTDAMLEAALVDKAQAHAPCAPGLSAPPETISCRTEKPQASEGPLLNEYRSDDWTDIRQINPNVTPLLKAVIETTLSFKPDRRYASAAEFRRALAAEPILGSEATINRNEPRIVTAQLRAVPTQDTEALATFPDEESLNAIERDLAHLIGPIARTLLRRSSKTARTADAFYETLAGYIENERERAGFLQKCRERTRTSLAAAGEPPNTGPRSESGSKRSLSPLAIAPEMLSQLEATLTQYIGPIAQVVLRKQFMKSASLNHLYDNLAAHIANKRDRAAFLRSRHGR